MTLDLRLRQHLPKELRFAPVELLKSISEHINIHGEDPCTRLQAAAHEAGHCVVATAIGETVLTAKIFWRDGRWLGCNDRGNGDASAYLPRERPRDAWIAVLNLFAGVTGEAVTDTWHPSSSLDETTKAHAVIHALSKVFNKPEYELLVAAETLVTGIILNNRKAFDAVRTTLATQHRISRGVSARLLASVKHVEPMDVVADRNSAQQWISCDARPQMTGTVRCA